MSKQWNGKSFQLGMLGGGQLGRMFIQEALNYDVHVHCLDPDSDAPCSHVASSFTTGSLLDYETVLAFGRSKDVVTVEIEHVNVAALAQLEKEGIPVYPQARVLSTIQDKGLQKAFYQTNGIPTAPFQLIENAADFKANPVYPSAVKLRTGGYDGKGVEIIRSEADLNRVFDAPCVIEQLIPFEKELSVIVARNANGETAVYSTVECEFSPTSNLVEFLFSPAEVSDTIEKEAQALAIKVIDALEMVGILAVELFLLKDGSLLVNEIAPRPHNSGHHTIECCVTSQFEQHLRSVINAPLGSTKFVTPGVMINLLGAEGFQGYAHYEGMEEAMKIPGVKVHLYGKQQTKPNRKMGHVTVYGQALPELKRVGKQLINVLKVKTID